MRGPRGRLGLSLACGLAVFGAVAARADTTTERSASILVFPKVLANGTRDTIIEISNATNTLVRAHCFYVNAALTDPTQPEGPLNPRLWQEIDFTIALTRQQPSYWRVSQGRRVDPTDPPCTRNETICEYSGFDPGLIPPVVPDFVGELKCVQVDDGGAPVSGNALIGTARLLNPGEPEVVTDGETFATGYSTYNAIGILGIENDGDGRLVLGGGQCSISRAICTSDEDCEGQGICVPEYNACPEAWLLNHIADNGPNLVLEDQAGDEPSQVVTELTIVPCTQNFETQIPTRVTVQFQTWNEFESQFSVSTSVTCWGNFTISELGSPVLNIDGQVVLDPQGTMYLHTRMRPAAGTPYGLLVVAEEFHRSKPSLSVGAEPITSFQATTAASNLHFEGERQVPDVITIPEEQLVP